MEERHYWIITLEELADWEHLTVRAVRDTFVGALEKNIKYISIISKSGENMFTTGGYSAETLNDEDWIEVHDEEGNLDITKTADAITKDFFDNRAIIAMRFEKDMYDMLGNDKGWLNDILEDD